MPEVELTRFTIYASHHQFTITDDDPTVFGETDGWLDPGAMHRQLVVTAPGQIAVGTTSYGDISVEVVWAGTEPDEPDASWQHVVEAPSLLELAALCSSRWRTRAPRRRLG